MKTRADEINRIFLWLLLSGGLLSLLIYGLFSLVTQPSAETITTPSPALNSNNAPPDVKFHTRKIK